VNRTSALACLLTLSLLAACSGPGIQRKDGSSSVRSFSIKDLAKSDVDSVVEIHQQEVIASLKNLSTLLYRRNPDEWRKSGYSSAEEASAALFKSVPLWHLSTQRKLNWQTSLTDAGRPEFAGDRVKSLVNGLLVMHMAAFNHETEFYLLTELNAQKFYNAARNTEYVAWELANHRDQNGNPLLQSNSLGPNGVPDLSIEREFGKLIGILDTLAKVVEDKTNRAIRFGVVNTASTLFLPI
jgi:hypothetical protein